jgi:hypothetical protein
MTNGTLKGSTKTASRNTNSRKTRGEQSQLIDIGFRRNRSGTGSFAPRRASDNFPYHSTFIELDRSWLVEKEPSTQNYCDRPEEMSHAPVQPNARPAPPPNAGT